jgi:hypothetical protein
MDSFKKLLVTLVSSIFISSLSLVALAVEVDPEFSEVDIQVRDVDLDGVPNAQFTIYILNEETDEYEQYGDPYTMTETGASYNNVEIPFGSTFCAIGDDGEGNVHALSGSEYPNTWIAVAEKSIKNINLTAGIGGNELLRSPSPYIHLYPGENADGAVCSGAGDEGDGEEDSGLEAIEDEETEDETIPTYYEGDSEDFDPTSYECADFPDAIFEDVEWEGCEAIWFTFLDGSFTGTDDGLIEWDRAITRAEVTKVMIEYFDVPLLEDFDAVEKFPDVPDGEWYTQYIYTARDAGIVIGYGDGFFKPTKTVSRAEMLKIFILTSGLDYLDTFESIEDEEKVSYYDDVVITEDGPWYLDYANFAYLNELVDHGDNFYPETAMTRLDSIKLLYRGAALLEE